MTQEEIDVTLQQNREINVRVDLLDVKFNVIDSIEGLTTDYNFTNNATSDIRRTCSVKLYNIDNKFTPMYLLNKYIQVYIGIKNIKTKKYVYTNMGIYLINNPNSAYSSVDNTITIDGLDLMAKLTGLRNGNLDGIPYIIPMYSSIKESMEAILRIAGFNNYVVTDVDQYVPYEIRIDIGGTVYDILSQLCAIVGNMQIYFDVDGIFHYDKIPSGNQEQISIDNSVFNSTLISYNVNSDFENVKNTVEVFGKAHENTYIGGIAELTEENNKSIYNVTIENITSIVNNIKIKFTTPNSVNSTYPYLKVNSLEPLRILDVNNKSNIIKLKPAESYVVLANVGVLDSAGDGFTMTEVSSSNYPLFELKTPFQNFSTYTTMTLSGSNPSIASFTNGTNISVKTPNDYNYGEYVLVANSYIGNNSYGNYYSYGFMGKYKKYYVDENITFDVNFINGCSYEYNRYEHDENGTEIDNGYKSFIAEEKKYNSKYFLDISVNNPTIGHTDEYHNHNLILGKLSSYYEDYKIGKNLKITIEIPCEIKRSRYAKKDEDKKYQNYGSYGNTHLIFNISSSGLDDDFLKNNQYIYLSDCLDILSLKITQTKAGADHYICDYYYTIDPSCISFVKVPDFSSITLSNYVYLNNRQYYIGSTGTLEKEQLYNCSFVDFTDSNTFAYLGSEQPHGIAKDTNYQSPFYINGDFGVVRIVLSGGEYDNIYSDSLAQQRAEWELYTRCKLKDNITLTCVPMYWADVNKLISIILPTSNGETLQYIIKSISIQGGVNGTQTLECMRYYPYYGVISLSAQE